MSEALRNPPPPGPPVTEDELHAFVDRQLPAQRRAEVAAELAGSPELAAKVRGWEQDSAALRAALDPVLAEPVPARLLASRAAASQRGHQPQPLHRQGPSTWRMAASCAAIAVLAGSAGWFARDRWGASGNDAKTAAAVPLTGFAQRAAVAHAVYTPEQRRPVEVGADQEQQLVTWLSRRLGTPVKAPALAPLGYQLVGGRLLPGDAAPVAQFMYQDGAAQRLTLYVTREVPVVKGEPDTAFRFGQAGNTQVFYWVDRGFGYALSGTLGREELLRVSQEVYRQLAPG